MTDIVPTLAESLRQSVEMLLAGGGRVLLGIAGMPGSGKSTLAASLAAAFGTQAVVVPMDGYHLAQQELDRLGRADRKGAPDTFDAAGYVALLRRLRTPVPGEIVYAPAFRRELEEPVAGAIAVPAQVRLVVTEGNYLLLNDGPWAPVRGLLDACWFVETEETQREAWLLARHMRFGRSRDEALAWTRHTDAPNARLVAGTRDRADRIVTQADRSGAFAAPRVTPRTTKRQDTTMADDTPVWFITGCSTGFGKELARLVLARGWRAAITARKPEQLSELVRGHEDRVLPLKLDVTEADSIEAAVAEAESKFGRIDVLVNNAGYGYLAAIEEGEDEGIRAQFETNVFGLAAMIRRVLPGMRARRSGHVVNFSSIGGLVGFAATGYYHATKFAVEGLSESLSVETAPLGIKVTIVEPGPFRTDWAGRSIIESKTLIDDYADTAGKRREQTRERSGNQVGDPVRGAAAIIDAVESSEPPLRLLLGGPALEMAYGKLDSMRRNFDNWATTTREADFPEFQKPA